MEMPDKVLQEDRLLTIQDIIDRLKIGRTRVYALLSSGELIGVKVGASRRIRMSDLNTYLESLQ
tara:strand:- start:719 stop:910 length:192 start_codon:yes stop_codon:yes gene_type:complete